MNNLTSCSAHTLTGFCSENPTLNSALSFKQHSWDSLDSGFHIFEGTCGHRQTVGSSPATCQVKHNPGRQLSHSLSPSLRHPTPSSVRMGEGGRDQQLLPSIPQGHKQRSQPATVFTQSFHCGDDLVLASACVCVRVLSGRP